MKTIPKSVLVAVGGWDPSALSGVLADVRVFQNYGLPHQAVLTAVTAQSRHAFLGWNPIPLKLFKRELAALDLPVAGVKIGMLGTLAHVRALTQWLHRSKPKVVVWDTVFRSSSGGVLLRSKKWNPSLQRLLEATHLLTPNIPEAEWILGRPIPDLEAMQEAAARLYRMGKTSGRAVILKGGHLPRSAGEGSVRDLFFNGKQSKFLSAAARKGSPRGTGCTFASALLAEIYLGRSHPQAAARAKRYVLNRLFRKPGL